MNLFGRIFISTLLVGPGLSGSASADPSPADSPPAPPPAPAQVAQAAPSGGLETVIVTAEKRSETVKEIPFSISAISGADLADNNIENVEDITRSIPNISFGAGAGTGRDIITMRGISSQGGNATVGIYLDDVPAQTQLPYDTTYSGATEPKLFDMARVEVLRGPQGTLYGAGSMGGTIRYIFNQPDLDTVSGMASTDLSGIEHSPQVSDEEIGVVNVPIIPGVLAVRAALDYSDRGGWINRFAFGAPSAVAALAGAATSTAGPLIDAGTNSERTYATRLGVLWRPDDSWTVTGTLFMQHAHTDDTSLFYPSLGLYAQDKLVPERSTDDTFVPSLTITHDFGWSDLTSVSSYFYRENDRIDDSTYYNSDFFQYLADDVYTLPRSQGGTSWCGCGVGFDSLPSQGYTAQRTKTLTQEVRLASKPPGEGDFPLSWVGGLYVSDRKFDESDDEVIPGVAQEFIKLYGVPPQDTEFGDYTMANGVVGLQGGREDERQYAGFANVSYNVTPQFKVQAGVRYILARAAFTYYQDAAHAYFNEGALPLVAATSDYHFTTPEFSATYDVNPNVTVYGTIDEGYRLGGFIIPILPATYTAANLCLQSVQQLGLAEPSLTYAPDHLWNYEAGTKTDFFDNHLTINFSGFYVNWSNVQQSLSLSCGAIYTTNFGEAESYGGEMEIRAKPATGLTLGLDAGYTHATLTKVNPGVGATVGEKLLNTPDWSATFRAEYAFPITDDIGGFVRGDWDWIGRSHGTFTPTDPNFSHPVYNLLNASFGIAKDDYELSIYGKNILDSAKTIQVVTINDLESGYTPQPASFGAKFTIKF
jgi:outer membrane receptor protein involved in Fe transport